ncbi:MAG: septum formation initiator family protein [Erysipelotrichaceae bacterium]|nr:septum formation initiator family protein [Erysipelotrichaceae bacterium]
MAKKKKKSKGRKKLTPVFRLICLILLGISGFFVYSVVKEFYTMVDLQGQLSDAQEKLILVQDENTRLTSQRDKLTDPDYVESYARSNYMLTKEGEEIYYLPGKDD